MTFLFVLISILAMPMPGEFPFALPSLPTHGEAGSCEAAGAQPYPSAEHGGQSRLTPHWSAM